MRFSRRTNSILLLLLIVLNIILRLRPSNREVGGDSLLMHIMINSLTEYGHAKWILHPLSFAGLYPYSYSSSVLFFISGIQQATGLEMNTIIFLYTILQAVLSIFTIYIMAEVLIHDDFFKYIVSFIFSTSSAVISYTTYTIGTRSLVIVLVPLLLYILLNKLKLDKKIILVLLLMPFLFVTHHVFFFVLPAVATCITLQILSKYKQLYNPLAKQIPWKYRSLMLVLIPLMVFLISFSIPFIFKKFLYGGSRYNLPIFAYVRYMGPSIIYSISGTIYLILKQKKSFNEWAFLLSTATLFSFIYITTYLKWFIPIFLAPLAAIGITNVFKSNNGKYLVSLLVIILVMPVAFTGYFQFYGSQGYTEESAYSTGSWIKEFAEGNYISNDRLLSYQLSAASDTVHCLLPFTTIAAIYDFIDTDVSFFERYPLSSDDFWLDGYHSAYDIGENLWSGLHQQRSPDEFGIKYIVENSYTYGNVAWNHPGFPSKILEHAYKENLIYDEGQLKIWQL